MDDLSHTLRVNYFGGTIDPKMAAYITGRRPMDGAGRALYRNNTDFNSFGTYLTLARTAAWKSTSTALTRPQRISASF